MPPAEPSERSSGKELANVVAPHSRANGWLWEAACVLICAYIIGVIFGYVGSANRLSTSEIALVAVMAGGALLKASPQWLDRFSKVKVGNLEFDLSKVKEEVSRVDSDLEHLRLMLAVTLPELAQDLLVCALQARDYMPVEEPVKKALRRLADQGLLVRKPVEGGQGGERKIGAIERGESFLNAVALTEQGKQVAQMVAKIRQDRGAQVGSPEQLT